MAAEPGTFFLFDEDGLDPLAASACRLFRTGRDGVRAVFATHDRKIELISYDNGTVLANVLSAMGYPAIYPLHPVAIEKPVEAVLMDLDGTSVHSEEFWIWIIERTTARLVKNDLFELQKVDLPYVSGHSVSEHLQYCIDKYAPSATVEDARKIYFEITHREMAEILAGRGRKNAFQPAPGLKPFLLALKARGIKIGLVTSGLYEKAWPEIVSAFRQLELGDPKEFYDAIITAGFPLRKGEVGTLGELEPKPHPWLYAETARVGLGVPFERRGRVVGIEDSGAGVASIRLAGFACIGMKGGNIEESGGTALCSAMCGRFEEVLELMF